MGPSCRKGSFRQQKEEKSVHNHGGRNKIILLLSTLPLHTSKAALGSTPNCPDSRHDIRPRSSWRSVHNAIVCRVDMQREVSDGKRAGERQTDRTTKKK
ncbi:hypothetical protein QQF64_004104 [Cirrhinus molitorella]|uniref:Uncharacterized protein n=1 Tax=Cirrhinus molitorella TaxID=172907 RepID=A0ABR3MN91_9TELE